MDALITTMQLPLAAYCEDDNVLPCVGNDAYSASARGELATPLELFGLPERGSSEDGASPGGGVPRSVPALPRGALQGQRGCPRLGGGG